MTETIRVAVPVPLPQLFDYLPPADGPAPRPGCRCEVSFGNRRLVGLVWEAGSAEAAPARLKRVTRVLDEAPLLDPDLLALCQHAADYYHHPIGEVVATLLPTLLRQGESTRVRGELFWTLTERGRFARAEDLKRAPRQQEALTLIQQHPGGAPVALTQALGIPRSALTALEKKGWIAMEEQRPRQAQSSSLLAEVPLPGNAEQTAAIQAIQDSSGFSPFLLEGVTGSGKTEVYLQAITPLLEAGKQALVLVPEIGLTPQTIKRFEKRFNTPVVALHSGLTDRERLQGWLKAREGEAGIILGTRSAVFTPLARPGLVIVDEAHDGSFKQQDGLRYSARDLAVWRARLLDVPVVLGSATPALETLQLARDGRYRHLRLTHRAGEARPPVIKLEDTSSQRSDAPVSDRSIDRIKQTLAQGQQALVFINRRGFAPLIRCQDCGWEAMCERCSVRMTWHRSSHSLICHHCDSRRRVPAHCPSCGSSALTDTGSGTEKVEQQLNSALKEKWPVIRIDRDSTRRKGALDKALTQIQQGNPAVLVGTQMLAKGHHFSQLSLAVILEADASFMSADFRGPEQGSQLLLQVAGRTGRHRTQGEVIIQSRHPDLPLWPAVLSGDYRRVADALLEERRALGLPPFGHLAMLRAESLQPGEGQTLLQQAADSLPGGPVQVMGPVPAPLERRQGRFRYQLLFMSPTRPALHQCLRQALAQLADNPNSRKCRWHLDVDPTDML